jgi:hypothetical protein
MANPEQTPTERGFDEGHVLTVEAMQRVMAKLDPEVRDKCARRAIAYIQPNYTKETLDDLLLYYNNHCMEAVFRERVEHLAWIFADERADTERATRLVVRGETLEELAMYYEGRAEFFEFMMQIPLAEFLRAEAKRIRSLSVEPPR